MTNEEILKNAIHKARKNGYKPNVNNFELVIYDGTLERYRVFFEFDDDGIVEQYSHDDKYVIFSHDFAKAFWGTGRIGIVWIPAWKYYLREMVLQEDPIKYLERFLEVEK